MSVVFEVDWLRWGCVRWLSGRMKMDLNDDGKYFLFEECLFIVKKWDNWDLMNSLILKIASIDNSSFITRYFQDFDKLEAVQIQLMLKLGGSNCQLFLRILLQHLKGKTELWVNAKILLEKMNLALCSELQNELYKDVTDKISGLAQISTSDIKFVLELTSKTNRRANIRNNIRNSSKASLMQKIHCEIMMTRNKEECKTWKDLVKAVKGYWIKSMYEMIDMIVWMFQEHPPTRKEIEMFVTELADMVGRSGLSIQKVSHDYLTLIIIGLEEHSPSANKELLILMLKMIKRTSHLSTPNQNAIIPISSVKRVRDTERKLCFIYNHPSNGICTRSDEDDQSACGFVIKYSYQRNYWKNELCRGKSLSRWVRNRDSCRFPRQIAIFGICRDISRQYTFSAISRDFLWFFASDCDFKFIYSLTVKFLGFLPSEF